MREFIPKQLGHFVPVAIIQLSPLTGPEPANAPELLAGVTWYNPTVPVVRQMLKPNNKGQMQVQVQKAKTQPKSDRELRVCLFGHGH